MGLFDRSRRDRRRARPADGVRPTPDGAASGAAGLDPDPVLPVLSRAGASALTRLMRESLVGRGVETVADGRGALVAMDGQRYGLTDLALIVAPEPTVRWPALVERHVTGLISSSVQSGPLSLDEVRDRLYPRLRSVADLPGPAPSYAPRPLPGVAELAAIDYPDHVSELLADETVERIGGWPVAREVAMANLRALPAMHQDTIRADDARADSDVHVLTTDDFFGPSRVLVLAETLAGIGIERPSYGVLVAVPNRHLLALHPLEGPGVVAALQVLARISTGEHDEKPGALSRHVYYVPATGAPAQQVTTFADDGTLSINVSGALAEAFAALGLLEG